MKKLLQVALSSLILFTALPIMAQVTSGVISGTVTDGTGAVMPGVKVLNVW